MSPLPTAAWTPVTTPPPLAVDEIQVWRFPLTLPAAAISRLLNDLSAAEKKQAGQFRLERAQQRFILRRAAVRRLLSVSLAQAPALIPMEAVPFQKPCLAASLNQRRLQFNTSHSGDWALIALSLDRAVGVDVEQHRALPEADELARRYFSPAENAQLGEFPSARRLEKFYDCWTRKEACLKALGTGLAKPLTDFTVTLASDLTTVWLPDISGADPSRPWFLQPLTLPGNYSAALAFAPGSLPVRVATREWPLIWQL
jgi:4'-phosphopantetheinyl transferase